VGLASDHVQSFNSERISSISEEGFDRRSDVCRPRTPWNYRDISTQVIAFLHLAALRQDGARDTQLTEKIYRAHVNQPRFGSVHRLEYPRGEAAAHQRHATDLFGSQRWCAIQVSKHVLVLKARRSAREENRARARIFRKAVDVQLHHVLFHIEVLQLRVEDVIDEPHEFRRGRGHHVHYSQFEWPLVHEERNMLGPPPNHNALRAFGLP